MAILLKCISRKIVKIIVPAFGFIGFLVFFILTYPEWINSNETIASTFTQSNEISSRLESSLSVMERFKMRKMVLKKVCMERGLNTTLNKSSLKNIYVNDKYKFIYCEVPKVACTNWKRILLFLSGKLNKNKSLYLKSKDVHSPEYGKYLRTLDEYSEQDQRDKINNYFKFLIVREPLERILSAYRNKFTMKYNQYFHQRYGRHIIKKYRKYPTKNPF